MPEQIRIEISADNKAEGQLGEAARAVDNLNKKTQNLNNTLSQGAPVSDDFGDESAKAAIGVDDLGRRIFRSSDEARKFNGVFRDSQGRLRDATGQYARTRESVDELGDTFSKSSRQTRTFDEAIKNINIRLRNSNSAFVGVIRGAGNFSRIFVNATTGIGAFGAGLGKVLPLLGSLGVTIPIIADRVYRFGRSTIDAAAQMEQFQRGLVIVEGTGAPERLQELIEVANLPGINLDRLINYNNRLRALGLTATEIDALLLSTGQTIVTMGGNAHIAAEAVEQMIQALQTNTVTLQDFRSIAQRIPAFYQVIGEVHDVSSNIGGLRQAVENAGGSIKDVLIPVMDELRERFEAPPSNSYVVAVDTLQNSFFLLQSEIGKQFLPTIAKAAFRLSEFFDAMRSGIGSATALPEPIREIVSAAQDLYKEFTDIIRNIADNIGPELEGLGTAVGTLLTGILKLAGSILNVLQPAFLLWSEIQAVIVALIVKLAEDIGKLAGGLANFLDWVTKATGGLIGYSGWAEKTSKAQLELEGSTNAVTRAIEKAAGGAQTASNATQDYIAKQKLLKTEIVSLEKELARKEARYRTMVENGAIPASQAMQHLDRSTQKTKSEIEEFNKALSDEERELKQVTLELVEKQQKYDDLIVRGILPAENSMQHLKRSIDTLSSRQQELTTVLEGSRLALEGVGEEGEETAEEIENVSLALEKLKARATDSRAALTQTADFSQIGEHYREAIEASDAYYSREIQLAQEQLQNAEANSEDYQKIETDIFLLQRERIKARMVLTRDATKVAETEVKRRLKIVTEAEERQKEAGEETARALSESQKKQTAEFEAEQKRLWKAHEEGLKTRESAEKSYNDRVITLSLRQLEVSQNFFKKALPETVQTAYSNVQTRTVQHYDTLKEIARAQITNQEELDDRIRILDLERNKVILENAREYMKRIGDITKEEEKQRSDNFKETSDEILHNWDRTVAGFERRLKETNTDETVRKIEDEFIDAQGNMIGALENSLVELGFTVEEAKEIMEEIFRGIGNESDNFANKVIAAFKRITRETQRETKKTTREAEREYKELINNIQNSISDLGNIISDGLGSSLSGLFTGLTRVAAGDLFGLVDIATTTIGFIEKKEQELHERRKKRAEERQEFENEQSIRLQNALRFQAIVPEAQTNQGPRLPRDEEIERDRGVNRRRQVPIEILDPQSLVDSGNISNVLSGAQNQELVARLFTVFQNAEDIITRSDIEGAFEPFVAGLKLSMENAAQSLEQAIATDAPQAEIAKKLQVLFSSVNSYYDLQIEQIRAIEASTGAILFEEIKLTNNLRNQRLNQARLGDTSVSRGSLHTKLKQQQETSANIEEYNALAESQGGTAYGESGINIEGINSAIGAVETSISDFEQQISQSVDPNEIESLLTQIANQIIESFKLRRESLQKQFDAGEITLDELNSSIKSLDTEENAALERNSDRRLANLFTITQSNVESINTIVGSLEEQISQSADPKEIELFLIQIGLLIPKKYKLQREALKRQLDAKEITQQQFESGISALDTEESAELERNSDRKLANALLLTRSSIEAINTSISELEQRISQSNDTSEIQRLLEGIAKQIPEIFRLRRNALSKQFAAGEITADQFNSEYTQIGIDESAAIERNSDAQLANALRINQEAVNVLSTNVSDLENQISQSNDPTEIARLLQDIAKQIPEIYRLRREALQKQFDAGEITLSALTTGLAGLAIDESAAIERNSDAQLANALRINQEMIAAVDVKIRGLEFQITQSDDSDVILGLLDLIAEQIPEIYRLRREALQKQFDEGEITKSALTTGLAGFAIDEGSALYGISERKTSVTEGVKTESEKKQVDAQRAIDEALAKALEIENANLDAVLVKISEFENRISESNDLVEIEKLLDAIISQLPEKYRLRRKILQEQFDAGKITVQQLQTGFGEINIEESSEKEKLSDTKLANSLKMDQELIAEFDSNISSLENQISQSNDPAEIAELLMKIGVQIPEKYRIRREMLQKQFDENEITLSDLKTGLTNLDTEESAEIENNSDAQLANTLRMSNEQIGLIESSITALENQISQSNDPAEIAELLMKIGVQIPEKYRIRREMLQKQFDENEITLSDLKTGLTNLDTEESAEIENNSDQILANSLKINSQQIASIDTSIAGFEQQISQSNDPAEIKEILGLIRIQIREKFRLRREALQKQYDNEEITLSELTTGLSQLGIDESSELEQNSDRQLAQTLSEINTSSNRVGLEIQKLTDEVKNSNNISDIISLAGQLRAAVKEKYRLQREALQKQLDAEEISIDFFKDEIAGIEFNEGREISGVSDLQSRGISNVRSQRNNLIENQIQKERFGLTSSSNETDFEERRAKLSGLTEKYYDAELERINGLELSEVELRNLREDNALARARDLKGISEMTNKFLEDRIKKAKEVAEEIEETREEEIENEQKRLEELRDLREKHSEDLLEIEEDFQEDLDDLREERIDDSQDQALDYQRKLEDLQTDFGRKLFGDAVITFQDLTNEQRRILEENIDYQRKVSDLNQDRTRDRQDQQIEGGILNPGSSGYNFYRNQLESGELKDENLIERLFGREGLDIFQKRQEDIVDSTEDFTKSSAQIEFEAQTIATKLSETLAELLGLEKQGEVVEKQGEVADTEEGNLETKEEVVGQESENVEQESNTAEIVEGAATKLETSSSKQESAATQQLLASAGLLQSSEGLNTAAQELISAARVQGLTAASEALISAASLLSSAASSMAGVTTSLQTTIGGLVQAVRSLEISSSKLASTSQQNRFTPSQGNQGNQNLTGSTTPNGITPLLPLLDESIVNEQDIGGLSGVGLGAGV